MRPLTSSLLLALAVALPAAGGAQQPAPPDAFFDSDGVRLRYVTRGSGPPVVLVHGFAVTPELNWIWPGIFDSLATRFTVIALDLRGHGASDKPGGADAYGAHFVEDVVRLLDHLRIDRTHVVGYSMGAAITLKLLTAHPQRVISAVLGGGGWRPPDAAPRAFLVEWLQGLERAARERTSVTDVLQRPDWPVLSPEVRALLDRNDPAVLGAVLRGSGGLAVTEAELRAITIPVLAVVGEADREARPDVERLAEVMADLDVAIVPGADHITAIGHPALLHAITRFLAYR